MAIKIQKRNGDLVPFDVEKIKTVINYAKYGDPKFNLELDINPLKLESSLVGAITSGNSTEKIQQSLIESTKAFTNASEPDYRILGGRFLVMDYWKRVAYARGNSYMHPHQFPGYLEVMIENNLYDFPIDKYSFVELETAYGWIVWQRDLDYDYAGANTLISRYVVEGELFQEMFLVESLIIAQDHPKKMEFAKEIYDAVSKRKISFATPLLKNLRKPKGNISSCFTVETFDSLSEGEGSITEVWGDLANISKAGGGCGVLMSRIRAKGSKVSGIAGASKGVIPWIKIIDSISIAVDQTGTRPAAITPALDIWHLDIEDFLDLQTEAGDERGKAHNLYPQIVVPDEFMRRVESNSEWTLVDPYEVNTVLGIDLVDLWGEEFEKAYSIVERAELKLSRRVRAKDLFISILKTWTETGLPYIAFKDTINRTNPNKDSGSIKLVNLCVESYSNTDKFNHHSCNLISINGANLLDEELESLSRLSVNILDIAIDLSFAPTAKARSHNNNYRTLGIGFMGLHDWLAKRKLAYQNTDTTLGPVSNLFEDLAYYCIDESHQLGKKKGSFDKFESSEWAKGNMIGKDLQWFRDNAYLPDRWVELSEKVKVAMRNSQLTAIAPNTGSSLIQGCTASVIPVFAKY